MDLAFIKLRVAGADLILAEGVGEGRVRGRPALAQAVLDRRRGVGGLRFVAVDRVERDFWIEVLDRDGSPATAPWDAALCATRWLLDSGRVGGDSIRFRRGGGEIVVDVLDGSSLGVSLGPLLALPDRAVYDGNLALARRLRIEAKAGSFDALPVAVDNPGEDGRGVEAVVFFKNGGADPLRVRLRRSSRGGPPPSAVPAAIISDAELRVGLPRDGRIDATSMAGMALGAASFLGRSDEEALVRSGDGGLWARRGAKDSIYVASRPAYVFRGDFHFESVEDSEMGDD